MRDSSPESETDSEEETPTWITLDKARNKNVLSCENLRDLTEELDEVAEQVRIDQLKQILKEKTKDSTSASPKSDDPPHTTMAMDENLYRVQLANLKKEVRHVEVRIDSYTPEDVTLAGRGRDYLVIASCSTTIL